MNYPLQTLIQLGIVPSVNFPTDSRYYSFRHAGNTRRRTEPGDYLPCAALCAAAWRAELCNRCAAHGGQRQTGWI